MGDSRAIRWVATSNELNVQELYARPVEGGREANGTRLYIARVRYDGGVHAAKAGEHLPGAQLAFNGTEVKIDVSDRLMVWSTRCVSDTVAEGLRSIMPQLNESGRLIHFVRYTWFLSL
jgi:uncharacterized protein DUF3421